MSVISVKNLSKHYQVYNKKPGLISALKSVVYRPQRLVKAVDDITFNIERGELVGFIGPNGAGKTTTLKCLSGLLYPTSGQVNVLGFAPSQRKYEYLHQIGFVMGSKNQLWWDIPPQETFLLHKAIYAISDRDYKHRLDFFIDILDIADIISVQTKKLSLGQRMKCEFVAALLHNPKVVFLDEPTIGLDVVASLKIREFVREYNKKFKTTVILTSHNMSDVRELCRRVVVIDSGRLHYDGDLTALTHQYSPNKILKFTFDKKIASSELKKIGPITHNDDLTVTFSIPKGDALKTAAQILGQYPVSDLNIEETPIEDIIRQVFAKSNN